MKSRTRTKLTRKLGSVAGALFILFPNLAFAEKLVLLNTDRGSLQARVDRILSKDVKEVRVNVDVIHPDKVGFGLLALLAKKAREGAKVWLILDHVENEMPREYLLYAESQGVNIREYNAFESKDLLHPSKLIQNMNSRLHTKMMVFNKNEMIEGGRNMTSEYFLLARTGDRQTTEPNYRQYSDRDVYISGNECEHAADFFDRIWESPNVDKIDPGGKSEKLIKDAGLFLEDQLPDISKLAGSKVWDETVLESPNIRFIHDDLKNKDAGNVVFNEVTKLIRSAKTSIKIENPYVLLTDEMWAALQEARSKNVRVELITHSSMNIDKPFFPPAFEKDVPKMLQLGIELWQTTNAESCHTKTITIDDHISVLGSFNFDPRSAKINTETAVIIDNVDLANKLDMLFQSKKSVSIRRISDIDPFAVPPRNFMQRCKNFRLILESILLRNQM